MASGFGETATYQFFRTERWLGRMEAIYNGAYIPVGNFDEQLDHLLAFFLNCHHIKDWLMNGPEWRDEIDAAIKRKAIEQFVTESPALSICADLCNDNKHFRSRARRGSTPMLRGTHVHIYVTAEGQSTTMRYTFRTQRGDEDAYALAQECVDAWRKFIDGSTAESLQALARRVPKRNRKRRAGGPLK